MTSVFITGAGGAGTIAVIESLIALGYDVAAADASVYSAGLGLARRGYVIPFGAAPEFEPALRSILERDRPDFVIPTVDEEIPIVHRLVAREFPNVAVLTPTLSFCEAMLDKWVMSEQFAAHGLSVAPTWLASDASAATYPAIVKPRVGRGSRGLAYLSSARELDTYLAAATEMPDRYIVQERIDGVEYTNSVVVALDGRLLTVVPKEVGAKRGITQVGITRESPAIDALCRGIVAALDPRGPFNVQLMLRADGKPFVFEVNPRYSTTVALTLAAGVNEVDEVIRAHQGRPSERLQFKPNLVMVRYPTQLYVDEAAWSPSDVRRPR